MGSGLQGLAGTYVENGNRDSGLEPLPASAGEAFPRGDPGQLSLPPLPRLLRRLHRRNGQAAARCPGYYAWESFPFG